MKKILAMLLLCAMLLTVFAACKKSTGEESQPEPSESTDFAIISNNTLNVRVIYSFMEAAKNDSLNTKIQTLFSSIEKKTGITIKGVNSANTPYDPDTLDIYIGSTGYDESIAAAKDLRLKDYSIVRDGNKLVIVGGSVASLTTALTFFMSKVVTPQLRDFSGNLVFTDEQTTHYHAKYDAENIMINGVDLKDYTLVIPNDFDMAEHELAYMLKDVIAIKYGYSLPVEKDRKEYENEILVGQTARTTIAFPNLTEYTVEVTDKNVQILAGCTTAYDYVDDLFKTEFLSNGRFENVKVDAMEDYVAEKDSILGTTGDIRIIFHNVFGGDYHEETYTNPGLRWNLIANLYEEYQADILCLQEFNAYPRNGKNANTSLLKELEELGYEEVPTNKYSINISYIKGDKKQGIDSFTVTKNGDQIPYTPVFYNPEKLELLEYGDYVFTSQLTKEEITALYEKYGHKLGTRYENPVKLENATQQYWDYEIYNDNIRYGGLSKMAVWAIFKDKATGEVFAVTSVHLDHQDTCYSNARREKQALELLNEFNTNVLVGDYANIPLIFGGDVNTSYNRENKKYDNIGAMQNFEADGYMDVQKTFADADQTCSYGGYANFDKDKNYFTSVGSGRGSADESIDHCFYKGAILPTLFDVMDHNFARKTSDHQPLVVDFKFN